MRMNPWAPGGDSEAYVNMGRWIFGLDSVAVATRAPLYSLFISATYLGTGKQIVIALLCEALVSTATVALVYALAHTLTRHRRTAIVAAAITAVDPFQIYFSSVFLSETLFTFLFVGGLLLHFRAQQAPASVAPSFSSGILMSLGSMCRSILLPFLPLFTLLLLARSRTHRIRTVGVFILGLALPMAAWSLFLHQKTGYWMLVSAQKGWSSYEGVNERFDDPVATNAWQNAMGREGEKIKDPVLRDQYFWNKTKTFFLENPTRAGTLMLRKLGKFWRLWPYSPYTKTQRIMSAIYMIPLLIFAVFGAVTWIQNRMDPSAVWTLLGLIALYSLANTITWTQIRYRIPLHPLLAILASVGIMRLWKKDATHA